MHIIGVFLQHLAFSFMWIFSIAKSPDANISHQENSAFELVSMQARLWQILDNDMGIHELRSWHCAVLTLILISDRACYKSFITAPPPALPTSKTGQPQLSNKKSQRDRRIYKILQNHKPTSRIRHSFYHRWQRLTLIWGFRMSNIREGVQM